MSAEPVGATGKSRLSLEGLEESRPLRALLGVILAAVVVAIIYAIVLAFTGHFTNVVSIDAQLPAGSNAVTVGAPVEYRNVTVGKLASETAGPNGSIAVRFDFYPGRITNVPKGVQAQVAPLSIFGNQYVNLVPPAEIGTAHLAAGDYVAPYTGQASTSLQGTVTQLYDLLSAVHPADLDTALTAFATALNGEGKSLGQALDDASAYTGAVEPHLPTVESDLRLLDPVSHELSAAAPDVLGTLANSSVTGQTITNNASDLRTALSTGEAATQKLADIFQQSESQLIDLMNQSGPLLSDVTANPNELSLTLQGLGQWAAAWASAESHGPFLSVTANLPVADISQGVNAALGYNNPTSIAAALGSAFNPATYTAANCPEYPGGTNPYCGTGGSPAAIPVQAASTPSTGSKTAAATSTPTPSGTSAATYNPTSTPYTDELQAIQSIATALNGGRPPASPALASLLLYPLFASMSGAP